MENQAVRVAADQEIIVEPAELVGLELLIKVCLAGMVLAGVAHIQP
jgi:hypothetical protein